ncbi:tyrosine-type recombinase/integrase [Sedimentibacter hydroxybenzoicus DSM 7310]|uniref:Tyrosine-type recombinase/integrase n=1 Tax=Sedimentibacter hydroxybenzoicus DSM 7310 TaxID=1123245 RepID=A0A974BNK3_SEDHY|nr:site-specific integrase [Sedimentibacter hydroxybenzoicus]NYB76157.1 tyrosine-type recombinase/integrase [Sedimentibacter hydroxybenzoicus DSM 7310]
MQKKPIKELLYDLEQELLRLGYTEGSMKFYRNRWQKILQFAEECNESHYSEQLGIDYVESYFQIFEKDFDKTLSQKDTQELRIIRMIGDYQLHHTVLRRYYKHRKLLTDPYFMGISNDFKKHCESKDYSKVTVDHYVKQSERFMDYLISQGIQSCQDITLTIVNSYIKTLAGYAYKTAEQIICSIRAFLRYLLEQDILKIDLASKTPMVQARKQTRIPSVWTKEELDALIDAIDRGNPKGKRDYAIILIACVLGLRVTDIKNLTFDSFHWEEKKLIFTQSKTRSTVTLPIPTEVGWAVIDYLKYGRPKVNSPIVFVRHLAPFLPFSESDHLHQLIRDYMRIAHIPTLKKHRGMHSLRHTAASRMLEHDTPLAVISDILGHIDTDSTAVYLKVDINKLKECCLNMPEVDIHE